MENSSLPITNAIWLACIWCFLFAAPAEAYFDLGMGTYMLQLFIGFAAALWFSVKGSLTRIVFGDKNNSDSELEKESSPVEQTKENL